MERQKRVLAVHDISGVGRCSLTVALPIISAAGVECSVLPTAVLSTHTGGFTGYTCRDLTDDLLPMARHWESLGEQFDAIYMGYLASFAQMDMMREIFSLLADKDTLIAVDPVMGDNGKLYAAFDMTFPPAMLELCTHADLIKPNMTEAALLLGEEYQPGPYTKEYVEGLLRRLAQKTEARQIVLTGVYFDEERLGAATFDGTTKEIAYIFGENVPGLYHGTGDVFGSALVGALVRGMLLPEAVRAAVDFTVAAIQTTAKAGTDIRYGVNFEKNLPVYMRALGIV
ncbi:MAG: pyridoxamine kinase [Selenomonadaceae bacterium]|nr:pyridoxamine kinase [Selenomonadaceae bacterium]